MIRRHALAPARHRSRRVLQRLGACLAVLGLALSTQALALQRTVLDSGWEFRQAASSDQLSHDPLARQWRAAQVPGTVHTDLLANQAIADPYAGAAEAGLQWIGLADWEYRRDLDIDAATAAMPGNELVFAGLDTLAQVWLNGQQILEADNAFRSWRVPVQGRLKPGRNVLRVVFHSPIRSLLPMVLAMPHRIAGNYPSPYGDEPRDAMTANFVRKPGYHYGWDWGPRYVTAGIWKPVVLESWDTLRIEDLHLRQDRVDATRADLTAIASVQSLVEGPRTLRLWMTDPQGQRTLAASTQAALHRGGNRAELPLRIPVPQRWYPAGVGRQPLYRFELEVGDGAQVQARAEARTGLRSLALVRTPDAAGSGFHFEVNGIPVFAKGANLIPFDMFAPRVGPAQLRRVLESAVQANMNMVRVWGGGCYPDQAFFDMADELGLLVWQDFMFGGGMQPAYDPAFRANVVAEAREQVRALRNHPSLALWCGNNEEEIAWKSWGQGRELTQADPAFAARVWQGYVQLFGHDLREVVEQDGGGTAYWASSPSNDLAEVANTPAAGDMHYWEVWGNPARPPEAYLDVTPRFMSEYGLQAWPVPATIDAFASAAQQGIDTPVIQAHQKFLAGRGNERLLHYIDMAYGAPAGFADFVYLSQAMQAEGIELAALHHRASRPFTMGSLYWQLNDVWPGASWSSIDWFGRWKALHFHARRFYAPVTVAALRKDQATTVSLLSDRTQARQGELRTRVMGLDGTVLRDERRPVALAPLSAAQVARYTDAELLHGADPAATVAVFDLRVDGEPDARTVVYFRPAKAMAWPAPGLDASLRRDQAGYVLDLHAKALARAVWIELADPDAQLSDNAMTLLPGQAVSVRVDSRLDIDALRAGLHVRTLADALRHTLPASTNTPIP